MHVGVWPESAGRGGGERVKKIDRERVDSGEDDKNGGKRE